MSAATTSLSQVEREVIELFVELGGLLGYPRSVGELYGMLFVAPDPMCADDLIARLRLSRGSASQGLRLLGTAGAIRTVYVPGDRRRHFEAEMSVRRILTAFIRNQAGAGLAGAGRRLTAIESMLKSGRNGGNGALALRIADLRRWQRRAEKMMPVLVKLVGSP